VRKILIATDGSPEAREAVRYGLELAVEDEAAVTLLQVIPPTDWTKLEYGALIRPEELRLRRGFALAEAEQLGAEHGVSVTSDVVAGIPADEIVTYADSIDADLIVIGSRGRGAVASALLGSVSRAVVQHARRPVLVLRGMRLGVAKPLATV
jgi:nucleotide-binding universal stress UspA family protein